MFLKLVTISLKPVTKVYNVTVKNTFDDSDNVTILQLTYIFLTGNVLNSPGTDPCGNIVCLFGLCIPQANLANI